ncbi:MAG: hypothetical protein P4L90_25825 [Rhodopila sp.]|nr:hypothetical protein [Rhodopila sp.]
MASEAPKHSSAIIEAIARLQSAFENAGLKEPVAIVVAGEEQKRRLEWVFSHALIMTYPTAPWDGTAIRGMKVISDVAA